MLPASQVMDNFQTRDDDDLFGDEIIPVQPTQTAEPSQNVHSNVPPGQTQTPDNLTNQVGRLSLQKDDYTSIPQGPRRGRGQTRPRSQGYRGQDTSNRRKQWNKEHGANVIELISHHNVTTEVRGEGTPTNDLSKSRWAHTPLVTRSSKGAVEPVVQSSDTSTPAPAPVPVVAATTATTVPATIPAKPSDTSSPAPHDQTQHSASLLENPPPQSSHTGPPSTSDNNGPANTNPPTTSPTTRPPPVRGDRTTTGGLPKPRLTDAELTAKLASARVRSQAVAAAHARAQADARDFAAREEEAAAKRREEGIRSRALEGERERNRVRKLKAVGGREWDVGKEAGEERASEFDDRSEREVEEGGYRGRGSGRGRERGRGRGLGRGRGRELRGAGDGSGHDEYPQRKPDIHAAEQFPALPIAEVAGSAGRGELTTGARAVSSWADQVNDVQTPHGSSTA